MKRILSVILSFIMLFVLISSPASIMAEGDDGGEPIIVDTGGDDSTGEGELDRIIPDNPVTINIIHTNDMHAALASSTSGSNPLTWVAGFIKVAAYIEAAKQADPTNTIVVDAGDFSQGTVYNNLTKGALMFQSMNGLYDMVTLGNHEFDWGRVNLFANMEKAPDITYLNANIVWKKVTEKVGKKKVTKKNVPMFTPNRIMEIDGVKIGFFGLASEDFRGKCATSVWQNAKILDPVKTAKAQVKLLKKEGVDIIVAVTHMGTVADGGTTSQVLRNKVPEIDVIIDGHSHTNCPKTASGCQTPARGALIASNNGNLANVTRTDSGVVSVVSYGGIGIVKIKVSNSGYTIKGEKVIPSELLTFTDDPRVDGMYQAEVSANIGFMSTEVGETTVDLVSRWGTGVNINDSVRGSESNMGNVIADAYRTISGAQIGIVNGGGVRASILTGKITNAQLLTVQPYGNNVVVLKMKGSVLKKMLEHSVSNYPNESGGFLQVSGMTFSFDASKKAGSRVSNIKIGGKKFNAKSSYTVAIPDFTAQGGDGFAMLKKLKPIKNFGTDFVVVKDYFALLGDPVSTVIEGRITIINPAPR